MDAEAIREIFADILPVRVRRMFGGHGVYDGELMFALEADGELYLKTDEATRERFTQAGSEPFTYHRGGKPLAMSYWRLPGAALDDAEALRIWTRLAMEAAHRGATSVKPRGSSSRARPR